jgi:hypothetical protein
VYYRHIQFDRLLYSVTARNTAQTNWKKRSGLIDHGITKVMGEVWRTGEQEKLTADRNSGTGHTLICTICRVEKKQQQQQQ